MGPYMRVKLPSHSLLRVSIELNEVETSIKKPASLIMYVVTLENDVQEQGKKAVTKNRAGPCLRLSISVNPSSSAAWTHIFLDNSR